MKLKHLKVESFATETTLQQEEKNTLKGGTGGTTPRCIPRGWSTAGPGWCPC